MPDITGGITHQAEYGSNRLHSRGFAHALDIGWRYAVLGLSGASGRSDHARQVVSFFEMVENGVSHCFHARLNRYRNRESRIVFCFPSTIWSASPSFDDKIRFPTLNQKPNGLTLKFGPGTGFCTSKIYQYKQTFLI